MEILKSLSSPAALSSGSVGRKAVNLAAAAEAGINVPEAFSVPVEVYGEFIHSTGLATFIQIELGRREAGSMRWEEMWDASLRIRSAFLKAAWPSAMRVAFKSELEKSFGDHPAAVRSSAPDEDSEERSFAGLHESYLNVCGPEEIMRCIKLVWSSLWSDAAILYRNDLGLDVENSLMSVIIQRMVKGECSGVAFRQSPDDPSRAVIEAVHGLNEGLVDGTVEPARWFLDYETGAVLERHDSQASEYVVADAANGTRVAGLPSDKLGVSPLTDEQVHDVFALCVRSSEYHGAPQDIEWTLLDGVLYLLQSRDITVSSEKSEDSRAWYLTLRRSYENLKALRSRIENEILPGMEAAAASLEMHDAGTMDDETLKKEITSRQDIYDEWNRIYYSDCIPMAHGMRLFGQFYNDVIIPDDPHEFITVLAEGQNLLGMKRNRAVEEFCLRFAEDQELRDRVQRDGTDALSEPDREGLQSFITEFSSSFSGMSDEDSKRAMTDLIVRLAGTGRREDASAAAVSSEREFLNKVPESRRDFAADLLELGRASYRLRDDDNIYLGRIEKCLKAAIMEAENRGIISAQQNETDAAPDSPVELDPAVEPRQLVGQPAGPGIATGKAYVIREPKDIFKMPEGAVMVCDAIDPGMTIAVPLASAIVERRGGMLIHGAIIAREYGIPCITGIDGAVELIKTGANVTVDGYLGILTL